MKSVIYICPTNKNRPSGGIKIIYRHVEILSKLLPKGVNSKIFHFDDINFQCDWFKHNVNFKKDSNFDPTKEFVIIPEVMAVYHARILQKIGVKYGIFVQNGFYLNIKPKNNFSDHEIKEAYDKAEFIISYSDEITECVKLTFPKLINKILRINISVDNNQFIYSEEIFKNKENLITYMPRKKIDHVTKLLFILNQHLPKNWKIKSIDNLRESEVVEFFKKSKIFLSFSEFEGFGLPPVEAALCGNLVIGYTGESGKEYWDLPIFSEVFSGDLRTFANKIIEKIENFEKEKYIFDEFRPHVRRLAEKYSIEKEQRSLLSLVDLIKKL
tara:strand:- start:1600 stop:2580 length:981 start_codon:yes stop_codon:yes gene_type:complete